MRKLIKFFILFILILPIFLFGQVDDNIAFDLNNFYDSERLLFSTTKINVYSKNNTKIDTSSGTGFVFAFQIDSLTNVPIIVTNKHVIGNGDQFSFSFTRLNENNSPAFGKIDEANLSSRDVQWIFHPDTTIDLAITPLVPILQKMPNGKNGYAINYILESDIPKRNEMEELKGVEEILMIGYPIGIWDSQNNMPITRRGITATHPNINFRKRKEFVVDVACFPGSSGSPILIVNEGTYSIKTGVKIGRRRLFMGILYGGPTYLPNGEIKIIEIPTKKDAISLFQIPINLGYAIRSDAILDFKGKLGIK